jgi:hypothetical protein
LGESHITEKFGQDELDIKLGATGLVTADCTINTIIENKYGDEDSHGDHGDNYHEDHNYYNLQQSLLPSTMNLRKQEETKNYNITLKKDVPKIKRTIIRCTFTNNSSKHSATIIATYPVPKNRKILEMTCKYARIKNGKMEFNITVPPTTSSSGNGKNSTKIFNCEIITDEGTHGSF